MFAAVSLIGNPDKVSGEFWRSLSVLRPLFRGMLPVGIQKFWGVGHLEEINSLREWNSEPLAEDIITVSFQRQPPRRQSKPGAKTAKTRVLVGQVRAVSFLRLHFHRLAEVVWISNQPESRIRRKLGDQHHEGYSFAYSGTCKGLIHL